MDGQSELKFNTMAIDPSGIVLDILLLAPPVVGQRIQINGRSYRITEFHDSVYDKFKWVISLGN